MHFNITEHPTAQWTAQQIIEAFPWNMAPRYLLRDRDSIYDTAFQSRVENMGIEEVKIAPQSPWQTPYCERVIGSIRRDALDHIIVLNETHLRRVLHSHVAYYHHWRTHLSLEMDAVRSKYWNALFPRRLRPHPFTRRILNFSSISPILKPIEDVVAEVK